MATKFIQFATKELAEAESEAIYLARLKAKFEDGKRPFEGLGTLVDPYTHLPILGTVPVTDSCGSVVEGKDGTFAVEIDEKDTPYTEEPVLGSFEQK